MPSNPKLEAALLSCATLMPEFDECADWYESDPERDLSLSPKEQAEHVCRMALMLNDLNQRAKARHEREGWTPARFPEWDGMSMRERLFVRRFNAMLMRFWEEERATHPERKRWSAAEGNELYSRAWKVVRAAMGRVR